MSLFNDRCTSSSMTFPLLLQYSASARASLCTQCHFLHSFKNNSVVFWQSVELSKLVCALPLQLHPNSTKFEGEKLVCNISLLYRSQSPCFFFFLNQAEKCGRLKIPVCIEERQLPPTSLVKELTSLGLSILKQLHIRMSGDPCRWLIGNV